MWDWMWFTVHFLRNFMASSSDMKLSPHKRVLLFSSPSPPSPSSPPSSLALSCSFSHWIKQGDVLCSSVPVENTNTHKHLSWYLLLFLKMGLKPTHTICPIKAILHISWHMIVQCMYLVLWCMLRMYCHPLHWQTLYTHTHLHLPTHTQKHVLCHH